ncbi:Chitin elicitor receptor kinase [Sesamum alatum]|uniref:non-specific serine/threonine protein kinase n=1 Tax=Sesamum alatum TaxID=300844 RepID=A0AAE1XZ27_9LAMI|nr:Chitin elicitor receptor kinase [Sesamum alatum]
MMKLLIGIFLIGIFSAADGRCSRGCDLAYASYYVWRDSNLTFISDMLQTPIPTILDHNRQIANQDSVLADTRINVPFTCDCLRGGEFLGHDFTYRTSPGVTYELIAGTYYANLTTVDWLQRNNMYPAWNIPDTGVALNVTVNCSCGDKNVSPDYGLFVTYPLRIGESLESVAAANNLSADLVRRYNPTANSSSGSRLVFIPGRGLSGGAIAGISVAGIAVVLLFAGCLYVGLQRKKKQEKIQLLSTVHDQQVGHAPGDIKAPNSAGTRDGASPGLTGITVDKSVEFSYEELASATDNFSIANKIGEGGFGAVYYAELRGEKAAIKKMDMQASKEFLAELKVLTNVHHLNLVRLIGYCVEGSLFLVYEYIENGNLSQHLRGSGREPLPWSTRVQIALDSARGLEYIHEHTVPVYIHRDIKPANILIDNNFHAKVADFGLTKLTEVGSTSLPTGRLVGTFGYMPPEYAQYGDVSPKVDVYAFGVVLYELISAKEAIVKGGNSAADSKGLVALFEEVLSEPDPTEELKKVVDPRLGDKYPLDSVQKMAMLARACTHENPQLRPTMRSIVVALMTLSSTTEDWDVGSFYGNHGLLNLMSGSKEEENPNLVKEIKLITGYGFDDPNLLQQASSVHPSLLRGYMVAPPLNGWRMSIGDAALDLFITKEHYFLYPGGEEVVGTNDNSGKSTDTPGDTATRTVPKQRIHSENERFVEGNRRN